MKTEFKEALDAQIKATEEFIEDNLMNGAGKQDVITLLRRVGYRANVQADKHGIRPSPELGPDEEPTVVETPRPVEDGGSGSAELAGPSLQEVDDGD